MSYSISEKFKSLQGEGLYTGTPMAFIRFTGCSVGKGICHGCDTDFESCHGWRGGGEFSAGELAQWTLPYQHVCLTGGEPLDQDLTELLDALNHRVLDPMTTYFPALTHIETSGTIIPSMDIADRCWLCVSPKPGFKIEVLAMADEIKVIVPGLGKGPGWPQLEEALEWAEGINGMPKRVYLQPRNNPFTLNPINLKYVMDLLAEHPTLRLSAQLHKILKVQ